MNTGPQLFVAIEARPGQATLERLQAALAAAPIASVLVKATHEGGVVDPKIAAPLVTLIQAHGAAALVEGDPDLARALAADGVHINARVDLQEAFVAAREHLGQDRIVGVEITASRHDAMNLAEMGADYIAFSGPERDGLVAWWTEVFVVPCVALDVTTRGEAENLAARGVEFIGLALPAAGTISDAEAQIRLTAAGLTYASESRGAAQ